MTFCLPTSWVLPEVCFLSSENVNFPHQLYKNLMIVPDVHQAWRLPFWKGMQQVESCGILNTWLWSTLQSTEKAGWMKWCNFVTNLILSLISSQSIMHTKNGGFYWWIASPWIGRPTLYTNHRELVFPLLTRCIWVISPRIFLRGKCFYDCPRRQPN